MNTTIKQELALMLADEAATAPHFSNRIVAVIERFFSLAETAASNGGFWVSAAGGTANVAAGIIARRTGLSYEDAHLALDVVGGPDWYLWLAQIQPSYEWDDFRWDVRTVALAACRGFSIY